MVIDMIIVGIVGASGYVGSNLIKLLENLKHADLKMVTSKTFAGKNVSDVIQDVKCELTFSELDPGELNKMDVVFLAVPHGKAKLIAGKLNTRIIDMSVDHRLTHTYGLPEVFKDDIECSDLVGNPGCYATAVILSTYPLRELINHAVFDCMSGYSGAGKNAKDKLDYENNMIAYKLTDHFHKREMNHVLGMDISYTPHVVDTFSGIMCTAHIFLKEAIDVGDMRKMYEKFYNNTFTKIMEGIPSTKDVTHTPWCHIGGFEVDAEDNKKLVIISVIDNLLKGASSQAIENMNIMFGYDHKEGVK